MDEFAVKLQANLEAKPDRTWHEDRILGMLKGRDSNRKTRRINLMKKHAEVQLRDAVNAGEIAVGSVFPNMANSATVDDTVGIDWSAINWADIFLFVLKVVVTLLPLLLLFLSKSAAQEDDTYYDIDTDSDMALLPSPQELLVRGFVKLVISQGGEKARNKAVWLTTDPDGETFATDQIMALDQTLPPMLARGGVQYVFGKFGQNFRDMVNWVTSTPEGSERLTQLLLSAINS